MMLHPFFSSLTECEQKFLSGYEIKMPNGLYSLNQNPEVTNMGTNGKARYCKTTMGIDSVLMILFHSVDAVCHHCNMDRYDDCV